MYVPTSLYNSNYRYFIDNGNIIVYTNENCDVSSPTLCDCYLVDPHLDYVTTNSFECSGSYTYEVDYNQITDDVYKRNDLSDILIIFLILFIFIIMFPYRLLSRLFGRWLKC